MEDAMALGYLVKGNRIRCVISRNKYSQKADPIVRATTIQMEKVVSPGSGNQTLTAPLNDRVSVLKQEIADPAALLIIRGVQSCSQIECMV
jgi:hypothetical protein